MDIAEFCTGTGAFSCAFKAVAPSIYHTVYANDIEPSSKLIFDANHDIELTCKDIHNIDVNELPRFDIMTSGFPCFVKGTPVLTRRGYVNIEDVQFDDMLMTHKGNYKKIINKQFKTYSGNLHNINCMYIPTTIQCTDEHPFLVRQRKSHYHNRRMQYTFGEQEWKPAKDLDVNSFIGVPVNTQSIIPEFTCIKKVNKYRTKEETTVIDKDYQWFMIGYFLGDGWTQDSKKQDGRLCHKICFVIANEQIDIIKPTLEKNFHLTFAERYDGCTKYVCGNQSWWEILNTLGKYAHGKTIPDWIENAPKEMLHELIRGYASADGNHINRKENEAYKIETVSLNLALGIQRILFKVGVMSSVIKTIRPKTCIIQGRTCNQRDTYKISWYSNSRCHSFIDDNYAWIKVKHNRFQHVETEPVYNFEVECDNSYVVNNLCVHNCQSFSIAGERLGFNDPRANVFWKLLEIVEYVKPRVVIFENVKNLQVHDNGTTFEIIQGCIEELGYMVKYKVMNTCEYTHIPQNRERIYIVCFRDETDYELFNFPQPLETPTNPIVSFLEDNIDNRYYYSNSCAIYDKLVSGVTKSIIDNVVYQYRRYYVRENKNGVCPTLTANMGGGGHNVPIIKDDKGIRKLTPRECFNLQGFDNEYILPNLADSKLYKLAGNAVTLPLVVRLVQEIHKVLFRNV